MQKRNLTVGTFLVGGVALFTLGLFLIGSQHKVFARHFEVYAEFSDIHGLTKGGKASMRERSSISRFPARLQRNSALDSASKNVSIP